MRNRSFFKTENKKDKHGIRHSNGKKSMDYPEVMSELYYRQLLLSNSFATWDAANAFRWIEGYANYVNVYSKRKSGNFNSVIFNPWEIVQVDFYGSYKNEMDFDHPALVYKVLDNGLLMVIPITSNEDTYRDASKSNPPKDLVALAKGNKTIGNLTKNSTLLLSQIKIISKHRIIKREFDVWDSRAGCNVKEKLKINHSLTKELIRKKLALLYSGGYVNTLNQEIHSYKKQVASLTQDLIDEKEKESKLQLENEELKSKYLALENKYIKLMKIIAEISTEEQIAAAMETDIIPNNEE